MLSTFIHSFFFVKNDDHFSFWDDFVLMFTLYRKKLSHKFLNLKRILLILAAVTQDYNIPTSGFSLKLDLLPSYSFKWALPSISEENKQKVGAKAYM